MAREMIYRRWSRYKPGSYVIEEHNAVVREEADVIEFDVARGNGYVEIRFYNQSPDEEPGWTWTEYLVPWGQVLAIYDVPDEDEISGHVGEEDE